MSDIDRYDWMFTPPPVDTDHAEEHEDATSKTNRSCRHVVGKANANALKRNTKKVSLRFAVYYICIKIKII